MAPARVFLSLSWSLDSHYSTVRLVDAAKRAIVDSGGVVRQAEYSSDPPATNLSPAELSRRMIRECDVYVGVLGSGYGPLLPGTEVSYAEFEYRTAGEIGIPRLMFLVDQDAPDSREPRQDRFRRLVNEEVVTASVSSELDLLAAISTSLHQVTAQRIQRPTRGLLVAHAGDALDRATALADRLAPEVHVVVRPLSDVLERSRTTESTSAVVLVDNASLRGNLIFELGVVVGLVGVDNTLVLSTGADVPLGLAASIAPWRGGVAEAERLVRATLGYARRDDRLPTCFISHAGESEFVSRLRDDLTDAGFALWSERTDIQFGADWRAEITSAINRAEVVLLVVNKRSLGSERVQSEIELATTGPNPKTVVPVVVDASIPESRLDWLRELFRTTAAIDFTGWTNETVYRKALRTLARALSVGVDR